MRFIRRLVFSVVIALVLLGVGLWYLVQHAREKVIASAQGMVPSIVKVQPTARFSSISFNADDLVRIEFRIGYKLTEDGEEKELPATAAWKAKPWDDVSAGLAK